MRGIRVSVSRKRATGRRATRRGRTAAWAAILIVAAIVLLVLSPIGPIFTHARQSAASAAATAPAAHRVAGAAFATTGIPAGEDPHDTAARWFTLPVPGLTPATVPRHGRLLRVDIPGRVSAFPARTALLYLPPAALVPRPRQLPVVMLLSGQSVTSSPEDLESGGRISETMDAIAAKHHGLAPIVVVPDQLSKGSDNPMCVDGPLGNSFTYLTRDVPSWISSHLRVESGARAWTIAGFSQGGTCALQLGAGQPNEFGNFIDISGQTGPTLGTPATTVAEGFKGSWSAYRAALPATELAQHAPYKNEDAFFAAGQDDRVYAPFMATMSNLARRAGIHTTTWLVPNGKHSWVTASAAIAAGMRWLMPLIGLGTPDPGFSPAAR